tara:strand:+ start:105 stop:665 length:561 start_codon:yes stop_codon:yes gene_type:complete
MTSVEDLAIDVGLGLNTADYEYFIDDVCDLLNDKQNNMIDKDRIASLCERSNLKIAKDVLYKCYYRSPRERTYQRCNNRERKRPRKRQEGHTPKWWQTYNEKVRKRSPSPKRSPLPKGRQLQEKRRRHERKQKEAPVCREMDLQFSHKTEDVPKWPGRNSSPKRRRSPSPRRSPPMYRRNNKRRRR